MSICELKSHIVDSQFYSSSYTTDEARRIFCDKYRYQRWLDIEAALALAQAELGVIPEDVVIGSRYARVGDAIILSGSIAEHGVVIMTQREGLAFASDIKSDTAPLHFLVERMLGVSKDIHVLRDPTRGGVGTALNEIADRSHVGIVIHEDKIPIRKEVLGICELMGFDPLYIANEGKLLAFVGPTHAGKILAAMHADPNGREARIIGEVVSENPGRIKNLPKYL